MQLTTTPPISIYKAVTGRMSADMLMISSSPVKIRGIWYLKAAIVAANTHDTDTAMDLPTFYFLTCASGVHKWSDTLRVKIPK